MLFLWKLQTDHTLKHESFISIASIFSLFVDMKMILIGTEVLHYLRLITSYQYWGIQSILGNKGLIAVQYLASKRQKRQ